MKAGVFIGHLWPLWFPVLLFGCSLSAIRRVAIPPKATATAGEASVGQSGEAKAPATAKTEANSQSIPLPAGTIVWADQTTGRLRYTLGKDSVLNATQRTEEAKAPSAFNPPTPPTIGEEKQAQADFWTVLGYRAGVLVGGAAALYGMVHAWPMLMWGGAAVAVACLFGLFVKNHPALLAVIGIGLALKVVGPVLWHTKLKHVK